MYAAEVEFRTFHGGRRNAQLSGLKSKLAVDSRVAGPSACAHAQVYAFFLDPITFTRSHGRFGRSVAGLSRSTMRSY